MFYIDWICLVHTFIGTCFESFVCVFILLIEVSFVFFVVAFILFGDKFLISTGISFPVLAFIVNLLAKRVHSYFFVKPCIVGTCSRYIELGVEFSSLEKNWKVVFFHKIIDMPFIDVINFESLQFLSRIYHNSYIIVPKRVYYVTVMLNIYLILTIKSIYNIES